MRAIVSILSLCLCLLHGYVSSNAANLNNTATQVSFKSFVAEETHAVPTGVECFKATSVVSFSEDTNLVFDDDDDGQDDDCNEQDNTTYYCLSSFTHSSSLHCFSSNLTAGHLHYSDPYCTSSPKYISYRSLRI